MTSWQREGKNFFFDLDFIKVQWIDYVNSISIFIFKTLSFKYQRVIMAVLRASYEYIYKSVKFYFENARWYYAYLFFSRPPYPSTPKTPATPGMKRSTSLGYLFRVFELKFYIWLNNN